MTEVQKLDNEIHETEAAAQRARAAATQAQADYEAAIEAGDVSAADQALQAQAQHERAAQIQSDRAAALEKRRIEAERIDRTPAALVAIAHAQQVIEAEREAAANVNACIKALEAAIHDLADRFVQTDNALADARHAIDAAHLHKHESVTRPGFADSGSRLYELARRLGNTRQVERSIQESGVGITAILAEQQERISRRHRSEPEEVPPVDRGNWAHQLL